jgi:glycosyltransferase involved in cell wall biosynthesis
MMEKSETENPQTKLSIVVVSPYSHALLRKCLESILASKKQCKIEILVSDCCSDEPLIDLKGKYPAVRFLQFSAKAGIPALAATGINQASGEIIALTDSSCVVDSNWIASILSAHKLSSPVIGGAVEIRGPAKLLDWAAYFCEYGQFAYPLKSRTVNVLPGNNISFKRSVLEDGSEYLKNGFWKTYWCRQLQTKGIELKSEPSILVYYTKQFKLFSFLSRRFEHGRCFAGMRIKQTGFFKRLIYVTSSFFLPLVFLYRTTVSVLGKERFLKEFLLSFPFIVLAVLFWSFGESWGYIAGKGKSCDYIC